MQPVVVEFQEIPVRIVPVAVLCSGVSGLGHFPALGFPAVSFRVEGIVRFPTLGFPTVRFRVSGFGIRVPYFLFRVQEFGIRVPCFVFRVSCCGFSISCFGFRVSGSGIRDSGVATPAQLQIHKRLDLGVIAYCCGCSVEGVVLRVQCWGCRVEGAGLRV